MHLEVAELLDPFEHTLHVGRPNIGNLEAFLSRVQDMFERRWFTNNGPYVQEFEARLKDYIGTKHCIPICNATIALELAIRALGMTGEVIVPAFTFVATAHSVSWQGSKPVFCEVDQRTHNLDLEHLESLIGPQTTGIVPVHVWGRPNDIERLETIARSHGLKLLFDAAHAFGCSYKGKMIGNFGDAEVFSFHSTKFFNSFEGGAIATNDDDLAARIRLMKNFGFAGQDTVVYPGTNGKLTEIAAAMGITSLESVDSFVAINKNNYQLYRSHLSGVPGLDVVEYDPGERNNYQYIIVEIDEAHSGCSRDSVVEFLHSKNVLARRYFFPGCHNMEPYRSEHPDSRLPATESLCRRVMSLPNGTGVSEAEIVQICHLIRSFVVGRSQAKLSVA